MAMSRYGFSTQALGHVPAGLSQETVMFGVDADVLCSYNISDYDESDGDWISDCDSDADDEGVDEYDFVEEDGEDVVFDLDDDEPSPTAINCYECLKADFDELIAAYQGNATVNDIKRLQGLLRGETNRKLSALSEARNGGAAPRGRLVSCHVPVSKKRTTHGQAGKPRKRKQST